MQNIQGITRAETSVRTRAGEFAEGGPLSAANLRVRFHSLLSLRFRCRNLISVACTPPLRRAAAMFRVRFHSSLRQRKLESDAEIRCRKYHTLSKSPARVPSCVDDASCLGCLHGAGSTRLRQWRQKRVLMRPEAAFPYVFAAEGAQHPPKRPPRSTAIAAASA